MTAVALEPSPYLLALRDRSEDDWQAHVAQQEAARWLLNDVIVPAATHAVEVIGEALRSLADAFRAMWGVLDRAFRYLRVNHVDDPHRCWWLWRQRHPFTRRRWVASHRGKARR